MYVFSRNTPRPAGLDSGVNCPDCGGRLLIQRA